uniref:uncharacterized protein LOC120327049 n=1 Tax=Styela clava TaxID=7725 RepID=UPI00193AB201|nr:uncharacterized protein LOC120327049 [Styela clava]
MNEVISSILVFSTLAVCYSSAKCCGKGINGFCNDCSKVHSVFSRGQKCCGHGSGKGQGCNVFCCGCGSCRGGRPKITYKSGWWFAKRYTCARTSKDEEAADFTTEDELTGLKETRDAFSALDKDGDKVLSPDEFLKGLMVHLNMDFESSYQLASDLLQSNDRKEIVDILDAVQESKDFIENDTEYQINQMARDEFEVMDQNKDGFIQEQEFDEDLK